MPGFEDLLAANDRYAADFRPLANALARLLLASWQRERHGELL